MKNKVNEFKIVTGLDIGSSKISCVVAEVDYAGSFSVLSQTTLPSRGVSRGTVEDLAEATGSVSKVLEKVKDKIKKRPDNIYVNISGPTVTGERSRGMIPLSLRGREITQKDMDRCINVASTIRLPVDREIIHRITHSFSVDGQAPIKNPLGLSASRLEGEAYVITANVNQIENIYKCVNNAGYDIAGLVFSGIADGISTLDPVELEEGAILIDVGASLTNVNIFFHGVLYDLAVISVGANDLKGDLKTSQELNDILLCINIKANELLKRGGKISSVTLTGGAAFADLFAEIIEERLMYKIKIGVAKDITGDISSAESVKAVTAIGLAKYGCTIYRESVLRQKGLFNSLSTKVVDILNNYF